MLMLNNKYKPGSNCQSLRSLPSCLQQTSLYLRWCVAGKLMTNLTLRFFLRVQKEFATPLRFIAVVITPARWRIRLLDCVSGVVKKFPIRTEQIHFF